MIGRLGHADGLDVLLDAILKHQKVGGLQAGNKLVRLVQDHVDIQVDQRHVDTQRVGLAIRIFDLGSFGRGRRLRFGRVFLLADDRSVIG